MLSAENFTAGHIMQIRENRKVDPAILERSIYALGLLEALVKVGMPFIFKGGTSLMLFPIVKSVMKWFGVNLTKSLFVGTIKNAIPVIGGAVGGAVTFAMFKPYCYRLKDALKDTYLSNPHHVSSHEEDELANSIITGEVIDVDYEEMNDSL